VIIVCISLDQHELLCRYYPQLKIKTIFVALQAKAGYEVLVCDFHVPPLTGPESVV
jgi:hypothetical protein